MNNEYKAKKLEEFHERFDIYNTIGGGVVTDAAAFLSSVIDELMGEKEVKEEIKQGFRVCATCGICLDCKPHETH